ncbi:MAG: nitrous oxide reductase family maturation protein NosD [Anaerolineales bacterium]|nr:nitrous oxide reductase family maturation protein NosD [Anaerolineales bacterium]
MTMVRPAALKSLVAVPVLLALLCGAGATSQAASPAQQAPRTTLIVSPTGPYTTIADALQAAQAGDVIEVHGGVHPPLVVDKPVTLEGMNWPVIDGGGQGTVVQLAAPGAVFRGFEVRGSGDEPDRDHSGIIVSASDVVVEGNRLNEVLFGVFVAQAERVVVRGNDITGKAKYDEARRGDAIRLWYAEDTLIEANTVHRVRDIVIWYSRGVTLRENTVTGARYGIHLMYADKLLIERNRFENNAVGIYTMYSKQVRLAGNLIRSHRGPSGYALGFKDADDVEVVGNVLVDNRGGLFIDATPFSPQSYARFSGNIIAFNDVGAILLTSVRRAEFTGNTFWENLEQMAVQGGGDVSRANTWRDNYWSDYGGYDADGDGVGDVPYRADRFFENLTDREPLLRMLIYSPAAQALEFAGAALPFFRPQPKLVDAAPRMQPLPVPAGAVPPQHPAAPLLLTALALLGAGFLCALPGGLFMPKQRLTTESPQTIPATTPAPSGASNLVVRNVTKRYGKVTALENVSFETKPGEAIALWGANGAGKSTLLKAVLGLVKVQGQIEVCGHDVRRAGKAARRCLGYVPQDVILYEQSVQATLEFFAALKGEGGEVESRKVESSNAPPLSTFYSPSARISELMSRLGLAEHAHQNVSALSGGLRQRLALAIALLADPPVLLLDEPTANLDAQAQRDYLALIHRLCKEEGKTVLFASHRLEEVELLANRVLVLEYGRLVNVVTPEALLQQLMPTIKLTLWLAEAQRADALARFTAAGMRAHLNGRGTVVVEVQADQKMELLRLMKELPVLDFEMERGRAWN